MPRAIPLVQKIFWYAKAVLDIKRIRGILLFLIGESSETLRKEMRERRGDKATIAAQGKAIARWRRKATGLCRDRRVASTTETGLSACPVSLLAGFWFLRASLPHTVPGER